ncbi:phosphotransferase [Dongia soli]|uniref:Hydroxylysine kinase n=1 Tax=Dongia soli TaxID=600628 RepID=A0ABU5E673_9PROT|nr:phosphotransferase [Dongia soli]MDY0881639.1 phosphotransferase [Dongia soli]
MRIPSKPEAPSSVSSNALLSSPPPSLSEAQAESLAKTHFGIVVTATRLTSERDANFRLKTSSGVSYVLKIANPAEDPLVTNLQTKALLHIAAIDADLPVQRIYPTLDGVPEYMLPDGTGRHMIVRLFSYLEGEPLHQVESSPALRRNLGTALAQLGLALRGFFHPAAGHDLLWDIKNARRMRELLSYIEEPSRRALVELILTRFDDHVTPALPRLRAQIVHNDLNPHNVLVHAQDHSRVTGILDFGDMVHTPLINDLAVAAAYQLSVQGDPLADAGDFIAAYHAVTPLEPIEIDLLYDLIGARLATTATITSWRAARYPENRAYILRNAPRAWAGLEAFAALPRAQAQVRLRRICGL